MAELEQVEWLRTNPQQSSATIQQLHAEVWAFRREMAAYFPTPNQADSLAFAFTEIAEAVDATLRQNPVYKRNNAKEHSVESELTQCAMMLLTAVPEEFCDWRRVIIDREPWELATIALRVAELYGVFAYENDSYAILYTVGKIATAIDLPTHLRAELARMRAKHGPVSLNEPANEHTFHYTARMERLVLPNPKDNHANYTANDAGEWVIV